MQANPKIGSMDAVLDKLYGKVGSPEREEFRKEAYSYCVGQIISELCGEKCWINGWNGCRA